MTSIISALWKSFYSQDLYQNVRKNWGFGVVFYLLLLTLLYSVIFLFHERSTINAFLDKLSVQITSQVPEGRLDSGIMSIEKPSPYVIYYEDKTKGEFAVFDMDNKLSPATSPATLIFHKDGYYYRNNDARKVDQKSYTFHPYPKQSFTFSAEKAQAISHKYLNALPLILFGFIWGAKFIFKLIQAIFWAFVVMGLVRLCKGSLTYGQSYRLAIIGMTPAFILVSIPRLFTFIPHAFLIGVMIDLIYMYFAAYSNRGAKVA